MDSFIDAVAKHPLVMLAVGSVLVFVLLFGFNRVR